MDNSQTHTRDSAVCISLWFWHSVLLLTRGTRTRGRQQATRSSLYANTRVPLHAAAAEAVWDHEAAFRVSPMSPAASSSLATQESEGSSRWWPHLARARWATRPRAGLSSRPRAGAGASAFL